MAVSTRIIKRRIKSIGNTKKITKAMELVSASKMRRAVNAVLGTRPYATLGWETVHELGKVTEAGLHPLLRQPEEIRKALVILVTSDRGLCGGFNAQMAKRVVEFVRAKGTDVQFEFVTIGKKGTDLARRLGWNIVATFTNLSNNPTILDIRPVTTLAVSDFMAGKYDAVYLAYTDFMSSIRQVPNMKQLLPLTRDNLAEQIRPVKEGETALQHVAPAKPEALHLTKRGDGYFYEYTFEPTPEIVLDQMLPRLVEVQVYQAVLESSASEHSARMVAMKNASDSARDMIDDLTFTFNQARQATITREIAEISAGKAALE